MIPKRNYLGILSEIPSDYSKVFLLGLIYFFFGILSEIFARLPSRSYFRRYSQDPVIAPPRDSFLDSSGVTFSIPPEILSRIPPKIPSGCIWEFPLDLPEFLQRFFFAICSQIFPGSLLEISPPVFFIISLEILLRNPSEVILMIYLKPFRDIFRNSFKNSSRVFFQDFSQNF